MEGCVWSNGALQTRFPSFLGLQTSLLAWQDARTPTSEKACGSFSASEGQARPKCTWLQPPHYPHPQTSPVMKCMKWFRLDRKAQNIHQLGKRNMKENEGSTGSATCHPLHDLTKHLILSGKIKQLRPFIAKRVSLGTFGASKKILVVECCRSLRALSRAQRHRVVVGGRSQVLRLRTAAWMAC